MISQTGKKYHYSQMLLKVLRKLNHLKANELSIFSIHWSLI